MSKHVRATAAFAAKYKLVEGDRLEIVGLGPRWSIGEQYILKTETGRVIGPVAADQLDAVEEAP